MKKLIIDLFAGGGGASTGIEMTGMKVDIAIDHDPEAIELHKLNHPNTVHYTCDVWEVDPIEATKGQQVQLLWASPDCKHFSKAKGGKPVEKNIRSLAWVVVDWAKKVRPEVIMLENVEEFKTWGPLDENNRPDKKRKGETFEKFITSLKNLGYNVEWKELRACDYGAPTIRKRLFIVARCDGKRIVFPERTHNDPGSVEVKKGIHKPWVPASEVIDFSIHCPSIFSRKKPLVEATMNRIFEGIRRFVVNPDKRLIINKNKAVFIAKHYSGVIGSSCNEPLATVTTIDHNALVVASLQGHFGENIESSLSEPVGTVTTKDRFGLVIVNINGQEYKVTDIGMRMLTPRELFNAQGFPKNYIIDGLKKTAQVRMCGNSVCPPIAEALVKANVSEYSELEEIV